MSSTTPRTALPLLAAAQAQKHVTHNEALLQLDALLFARLLDRDLAAPPASPADGDTYLVAAAATGAWSGQSGKLAYASDGAWRFVAPFTGLAAYVVDESKLVVFTGSAWVDYASILTLQNVPLLGVNATADSTNKLAVKSSALLFDNIGGGIQAKLNKHAGGDTASLLYQDNYSGRAELGLTGDDDFHVKVSADGATWYEALKLARAGGAATFVAGATASAFVPSGGAVPANGLYLPAANTLGWSVNAAERARLTATGLGVLTTAGNGALTVGGVIAPDADNTRDLGSASFAFRTAYIKTGLNFLGTAVTAVTGSGSLVLSASPTLTGTALIPRARFGANALQSTAFFGIRDFSSTGSQIEFGHTNTAGYLSTLGAGIGSGSPFLSFCAKSGATNNTFETLGVKGGVFSYDVAGPAFSWGFLATATANNQTPVEAMRLLQSNGHLLIGTASDAGSYLLQVNSQIWATNATIATSDLTRKTVLAATRPFRFAGRSVEAGFSPDLLAAVRDIPALMYRRSDEKNSRTQFGYGAQHWQAALDRAAAGGEYGWRAVQAFADGTLGLTDSDAHTLKIAALEHFKADRSEVADLRARLARLEDPLHGGAAGAPAV